MIGLQYLKRISQLLNDSHPSEAWLDKKTSFDFLYDAAREYVRRTSCLRSVQNITTIAPKTITGASKALPCSITCAAHGLTTGTTVLIKDIVGMNELNSRRCVITRTGAGTFTLDGIDSSGYTTYSSGGTVYPMSYICNYDFLNIYQFNPDSGRKCIQFTDGTSTYFVDQYDYDDIAWENIIDTNTYPKKFSIIPQYALPSTLSGSATSAGAHIGGESILTDSTAPFASINAGDEIINKAYGYLGIVLANISTSALKTAIFNFSSNLTAYASWTSSDTYQIIPRPKFQLILDTPLSLGGNTITATYVQSPIPVYSDYGSYTFPSGGEEALINYAAWLYKYREKEPSMGDRFYAFWEKQCSSMASRFDYATSREIKTTNRYRI